jgi:hypothetical protein
MATYKLSSSSSSIIKRNKNCPTQKLSRAAKNKKNKKQKKQKKKNLLLGNYVNLQTS